MLAGGRPHAATHPVFTPHTRRTRARRQRGAQEAGRGLSRSPKSQSVSGASRDWGSGERRPRGRLGGGAKAGAVPLGRTMQGAASCA